MTTHPRSLPVKLLSQPAPSALLNATSVVRAHNVDPEAGLVHSFRAGESWAREVVFDRHAARVERVLVRVLGPDPEVADLAQEVFVSAFRGASSFRGDSAALPAYLTRIAVFMARAVIRRRALRRALSWRAQSEAPPGDAQRELETHVAVTEVYAVLGELSADDRIVLSLRWLEAMELREVAEVLGVSLATVKRRLARARKRFLVRAARRPGLASRAQEAAR